MKLHLDTMGIKTAMDLAKADPWTLRKKFSVVIEKTARELAGTPCLELDEPDPPKQDICCSRMFGQRLTELPPIKEAVATYMMRASEKLRAQGSQCKKVRVCIRTGMFNPDEANNASGKVPTDVSDAAKYMERHPDVFTTIEAHDVAGADNLSGVWNFDWAAKGGLDGTSTDAIAKMQDTFDFAIAKSAQITEISTGKKAELDSTKQRPQN